MGSKGGMVRGVHQRARRLRDPEDGEREKAEKNCCLGNPHVLTCEAQAPGFVPGSDKCDKFSDMWKDGCEESINIFLHGVRDPSGFIRNATLGGPYFGDVRFGSGTTISAPKSSVFSPEEAVRTCDESPHIRGVVFENVQQADGSYPCYFIRDIPPIPLDFRRPPDRPPETWAYLKNMKRDPNIMPFCMTNICSLSNIDKWTKYRYCGDIARRACVSDPRKPWCRQFCRSKVRDCDEALKNYCQNKLPLRKALADELCGCFLPQAYYTAYYARLRKQFGLPAGMNEDPRCGFVKCALPLAPKPKEESQPCPPIQICAQQIDIRNQGTINEAKIEQTINCIQCVKTASTPAEKEACPSKTTRGLCSRPSPPPSVPVVKQKKPKKSKIEAPAESPTGSSTWYYAVGGILLLLFLLWMARRKRTATSTTLPVLR